MNIQLIFEHKLNNINFWLKLIIDIIPVFIGAALAFYWNVKHEEKKKKNEEVNKNKEFLANLYLLTDSTYKYLQKYLLSENNTDLKKEIKNSGFDPLELPSYSGLVVYDKPLNVKNISFCSRVDKYYNFIPNLYITESNIQRLNIIFKKHMELTRETNEKIYIYNKKVRESKEKPNKLLKEVLGENLYIE